MTDNGLYRLQGEGPLARRQGDSLRSALFRRRTDLSVFIFLCALFVIFNMYYFINLLQWSQNPEFGLTFSTDEHGLIVWTVEGVAKEAGIRVSDRIIGVNDHQTDSLVNLRQLVTREVPGINRWRIERQGQILTVETLNQSLGFAKAFVDFGVTWLVGIAFFCLGAIVFLMKPGTHPSWAFLLASFVAGIQITFINTSKFSPAWLEQIYSISYAFLPAAILYLAQIFPVEWSWLRLSRRLFLGTPFLVSSGLALMMVLSAPHYKEVPQFWKQFATLCLIVSLAAFAYSIIYHLIKAGSVIARARSGVMLGGLLIAMGLPVTAIVLELFFNFRLFPHFLVSLLFYVWFPISIAYSIVRHNLFDVDVYIKQAAGYGLMTVLLAVAYYGVQTGLTNFVLKPLFAETADQAYPFIFALLVVLLFNPLNNRVQQMVDALFFRKTFDYKETVRSVGSALSSMLDLQEIIRRIISTVRQEMYIDTAGIVLLEQDTLSCLPYFLGDDSGAKVADHSAEFCVSPSDPLIDLIGRERKLITCYDIEEDPRYEPYQASCGERFAAMRASLGLPLVCHDELLGVLFLGYKKSGKFYTREDVDLLQTLATQGAIALENARLAEQMKKEMAVRTNLTRYLSPQIVDQVVQQNMELNLGGRRKTVTILFSDIRGFTTISETWPPDQLVTVLNEYFTEMVAVIFQHKGTIDKFVGDAIVAVFGGLIELENPAQNAAAAAIHMMRSMPALNARWTETYGVEMHMGIGVTTGEVFIGNIGSPDRMEFTVIGDQVNVASRFSGLAKAGQILASRETVEQLGSSLPYRPLPKVKVKGKAENMDVFEILHVGKTSIDSLNTTTAEK